MKTRQPVALAGIFTIILLMTGFGAEGIAQFGATDYWYIGTNGVWQQPGNWSTSSSGSPSVASYPTAGDNAHFRPIYSAFAPGTRINGNYIEIPSGGAKTIAKMYLETGSYMQNFITTYVPMQLILYTSSTLTVATLLDMDPGTSINLASNPGVSPALILNGTVTLDAGASSISTTGIVTVTQPTQIYGTSVTKKVVLGSTSTLSMGDLRATYFGERVHTYFQRSSGLFTTDVRFNDDVFIDLGSSATSNLTLAYNLWLDKYADILEYPASSQTSYSFVMGGSSHTVGGLIVKSVDFWKNSSIIGDFNTNLTAANGYFEYPVGSYKGTQSQETYLAIWIQYARELTYNDPEEIWVATASEPFRGVGVRCVSAVHPDNPATNPVERYWIVQPFGLDQDNNQYITPYYQPENEICIHAEFFTNDVANPNLAYGARYSDNWVDVQPNGTGVWYNDGANFSGTNVRGRLWVELCITHGFGDVSIADGLDPVPVELTSFSARWFDGAVRLNWQTATEINNFGFAIERSADGEHWEEVGFVPGHGNSSSTKSYEHMDVLEGEALHLPELAYRLRQMDRDGTTEYSNIVNVFMGELPEGMLLYAAYPNPFNPSTTISFAIGTPSHVTLKVYNTLGQVVATLLAGSAMDAGLHTVPFDGATLPSGLYMAVLEADGAVQLQKLVLNK